MKGGSALGMGTPGAFVTILRILEPPQQLSRPEPFPGQHLLHHPVDPRLHEGRLCGLVIRGIFPPPPKPVAGSGETFRPADTGRRDDAIPSRCGSHTCPAPRRSSPSRTPFLCATGSLPRMPGSLMGYPPERWTGSSGIHRPKRQLFVDAFKLPPRKRPGRPKTKRPIRKPRRKPTVRKPAKKAKPKNQERRPRSKPTQAEVEAKRQEQLKFDRQRSKTPERREQNRLRAQEKRRSAKGLGLCRDCPNPSKPDETRCSTCTEKHRVGRRKNDAQRRAAAKLAETTDKADH